MIDLIHNFLTSRISVKLIICYISGILICYKFGMDISIKISIITGIVSVCLTLLLFLFKRNLSGITALFCVVLFLFGSYHLLYTDANKQSQLRARIGEKSWIYGTVISSHEYTEDKKYYSVIIDADSFEYRDKSGPLDGKIRIFVKNWKNTAPEINDNVFFFTELQKPDFKEGTFDYELYLKTNNIYATGFTNVLYLDEYTTPEKTFISEICRIGREINLFFRRVIDNVFSYDADACALIKGILLGDKTDFSDVLTDNLSKAGISHITAVSGLHLNILFGALCGFLGFFKIRKKYVAGIILPVILLFSAVTNFTPSVCRAAIMLAIHMLALLSKRQYDSLTALFVSAFIILMVNPYALFSISFILSFSAALSIIVIYPILNNILKNVIKKLKIPAFIAASILISVSTFAGTAPFIAYYFERLALSSFITNIWVIPLCTVVFILGYVSCIASLILPMPILNLILYPLALYLEIILKTAEFSAKYSFLNPEVPNLTANFFIAYFLILFTLCNLLSHIKKTEN